MIALGGVIPVLATPFDAHDALDRAALRAQIELLLADGAEAVALGFGSEIHRLTERERDVLLAEVVEVCDGRASVVGNVAAGSSVAAAERLRVAAALGAVAAMMPAPAFARSSPDELVAYYAAAGAAGAGQIAIVVQDAPAVTGFEMGAETLARIAREAAGVCAVKAEGLPSPPRVQALRAALGEGVAILGGNGGADLLAELRRGVDGTMPGPAHADRLRAIWDAHSAGNVEAAQAAFIGLLPLLTLANRDIDTFLWVQKTLLRRCGVPLHTRLRAPASAPDAALRAELDALIAALDRADGAEVLR